MDTATVLIGGAVALVVALMLFVVLHRSWGDFPERAGQLEPDLAEMAPVPIAVPDDEVPLEPVPIRHPLVRRAVESALNESHPIRRYVFRQGPDLFFSFEQIADPLERREAYRLMRQFEAGDDVDVRAMLGLIRRLTRDGEPG